ncbi:LXG domain-containing protein [Alkalihalophilus pseudofirmus]|uniref:LXG domain-containing protein n=1 Tax=Alkalihalophilus pseudofirmus TaxID=79885 RepID=A0AAJ2L0Y2_ALKPS|nr:LXG domain-containing protein [Alkalihalophilus pseudofirmus]MDV2884714.1 LXG domain-containing protein [Alkalihalophilus pseudofirmus]
MKTLDVSGLHRGIDEIKTKIEYQQEQLKQIETSVMGIVRLSDSLKGEGGTAIRRFYQECHLPFIHYLTGTLAQYEQLLMQMKSSLQALEPASNGRIQESFLEQEVENGLKQVELVTTALTNQTNATMQKVQDIVYLKPLQDDEVRQYVQKAKQIKDQTLEQLHQFDYEQAAALGPVETDTHVMQSYIKEIQAMFKEGAGLNQGSINLMINHSSHMLLMNKLAQRNMSPNLLHTNQLNSLHTNWQDPITFNQWYNPSCAKPVTAANATAEAEDTGGFFKGAWQGIAKAFTDTVDGIKRLVTEPVEVLNETVDFITDVADDPSLLLDIGHALWISFDENVINGTASTRGEWIGYTSAIIGGSVLGDKGLSKVSQAGRLGQLGGKPGYSSHHQLQLQLAAQNSLNQTANAATNARGLTHIRELAQQSMNRAGAAVQQMTPNAGLQPALAGIPHNVINTNGMRNQLGEINQANLIKVEQGAGVRSVGSRGEVTPKKKPVPDWLKDRWEAGNNFNKENRPRYPYNEVELEAKELGGKKYVVDSYAPNKEIVSRKFTQLSEVQEKTAKSYLNEITKKYSSGSKISDSTFNPNALKGGRLKGELLLEVPVQNKPIPHTILDEATKNRIIIRDTKGRVYN